MKWESQVEVQMLDCLMPSHPKSAEHWNPSPLSFFTLMRSLDQKMKSSSATFVLVFVALLLLLLAETGNSEQSSFDSDIDVEPLVANIVSQTTPPGT